MTDKPALIAVDRRVTLKWLMGAMAAGQLAACGDGAKGLSWPELEAIKAAGVGKDPDFFSFYRSMQAYETGLKGSDTRLVISPNSDFFRYFSDPQGRSPATAPRAAREPAATGSTTGSAR